ncbi:uncharacterized protein MONOS_6796 [Monocercomonoides exilis]|uniref:uncharacterized protein n=1 Tax=Monocercomonoides exilis TaxID=2049356 RepID=UPI00355A5A5E|nr:putative membrane protein [Monocercomonoides exilis]|eukprot:MONOS_6796.1-p1 / transcript=MONOS_6796.1 / gene=MONOS_6796 / organism=Monocercomonoides_exilis_PA203 / gene_product=putative uncharacterized protein / transcript_product=putative uncharacterized protein / location=Mono_scaffold00221:29206-30042(+) / protein_length=279 / sequence_SO=supercontig / SO=protein_coding / is_pseudo=false
MILEARDIEIVPSRNLNYLYIPLDCVWLILLLVLLFITGRHATFIWSLCGGVLYWLVDFGIFHLALNERKVVGANTALFLLWLSMSYGITNFAYIWLWLRKDKRAIEFTILIVCEWITTPLVADNYGAPFGQVSISRGTGSYHGFMAIFLAVSYSIVIIINLFRTNPKKRINLLWLNAIGITVQFGWEFSLLITGIRPMNKNSFFTLIIDSLVETNLGLPAMYGIFLLVNKKFGETFWFKDKMKRLADCESDDVTIPVIRLNSPISQPMNIQSEPKSS